MSESRNPFDNTSRLLAVLINEQGGYTYVDKLGNAPSKDLAIFYLREALRDYHSILSRGFEKESSKEENKLINFLQVENDINQIESITSAKDLREKLSFIATKSLTILAKLKIKEVQQ
ncbi:MAG: type I-A CRISPR-associated protein Csa5 [Nitrososphaeria archaeon]